MNRLLDIGFEASGHWLMEGDRLKFELTRNSTQNNILYAFVCNGQVNYVGKTVRALQIRMSGYKNPSQTQITNINNHLRIKALLSDGVAVDIFALPDSGLLHYGQFHLNLAAALEDDIIRVIKPEWNGGKIEAAIGLPPPDLTESKPELPPIHEFTFILQPTYYNQGFFNVGVAFTEYLGADGEIIELFLASQPQPVLGTINRRAAPNGTPRIMGGPKLKNWFQANANLMGTILVDVLSPTSIRLNYKKI